MVKLSYEGCCRGCPYPELILEKYTDGDRDVEERYYDIRCVHENSCLRLWLDMKIKQQERQS